MQRRLQRCAAALLLAGLASAAQAQLDLRRLLPGGEIMQRGNCDKLKRWLETPPAADPVQQPQVAARRSPFDRQAPQRAMPQPGGTTELGLIADDVFVPIFGKPYDQLTQADLTAYQRETLPACHKLGLFTPAQAQQASMLFNPGTHPMFSQRLAQRRAQSQARATEQSAAALELRQMQAELGQLEASDAGLARLQQMSKRASQLGRNAGAQDVAAFEAVAEQSRQRLAGPAQQDRIAKALAEPADAASLPRLLRVEASLDKALLPAGDPQLARLQDRIHGLTAATAAAQRAELAAMPAGIEGLAAGVEWSARTLPAWRNAQFVPPEIQRVLEDFRQLRAKQLASPSTSAQFKAAANATRTPAAAEALLARYLLPDETNSAGGQTLQQAVADRQAAMERNVALGRSADAEPRPESRTEPRSNPRAPTGGGNEDNARPDKRTASSSHAREPLQRGEPSEEVMFDMVNLRFTRAADNYRNLQQKCNQMRPSDRTMGASMDTMLCATLKLQGALTGGMQAEPVKITKFKKLGCERASGKPGYVCDYKITTSHPVNQQMGSIMGGLMGQGGVGQARFLDAGDEWLIFYRGSEAD